MVLMGPTNNGGLGNEVGIGVNYLAKGAGGHHMTSSGIYESGSNVGIGTSSPSSYGNLTVVMPSSSNGTGIVIKAINDGGSSSQPALTYLNGSGNGIAQIVADNGTGYLAFNMGTSLTEKMRITSGGNVGIGTSSPDLLLHVEGQAGQFGSTTGYRTSKFTAKSSVVADKPGIILGYDTSGGGIIAAATESTGQPINFWTYNGASWGERMRISSAGNVGINDTAPSTRLSINGANYVEMATFACTSAAASSIVSANSGYVQFSSGNARHCSNSSLFVPTTDGIQITKAGIVHISFSQDITTSGTTGYVAGYIQKNKTNISENLITNTDSQWDGINGVATIAVAANDVINFSFNASDILSFDADSWSQYSFIWTSR
jgi:hypothetical protein